MKRRVPILISIIAIASLMSLTAFGQFTSSISGTIQDPNGEVVSGATVIVKNTATSAEFRATSSGSGIYSVPSLGSGTYIVTVSAQGFKQSVVRDVKLDSGVPATVNVKLELGAANESVVVQGGGEIVQTQTATVSTTLQVKQIASLPLQTRNVVDFVVFLPGTNTTGAPRDSIINGLPQSALNITIDGINSQTNSGKTTDGFFSFIHLRLDAIEEVTVSTATPEAQSGGQGAVQIKFVTRPGGSEFHGSLYEYHRNPALNANYWFNNRNTSYNVEAAKTCGDPSSSSFDPRAMVPWTPDCRAPRARVLLNQYGGRIGGPILIPKLLNRRDKAFFFFNYEEFRLPNQVTRNRTIFNPLTQTGVFQYNRTVNGQPKVEKVDLLTLAANNNQTSTIDPTIGKLLQDIRNSTSGAGGITQLTDPNLQRFTFINSSNNIRYYPTLRIDINLTDKHRVETSYYYQNILSDVDSLNSQDPAFPGFPNFGNQFSNRFALSTALRSTLSPTLVNEGRFGFTGGTSLFRPNISPAMFNGSVANQLGFNLGGLTGNNSTGIAAAAGINGPTASTAPNRNNAPLWDFSDTLTWMRGSHNLRFGGQFTQVNLWSQNQTKVPSINFGVNTNDPANGMFNTANFTGASQADLDRARGIYAVLTGRITSINANARIDEKTGKYVYLGEGIQRGRQREFGVFAQDSWRMRPSLTLNYGLRWEVQFPFTPLNSSYSTTTIADLFGVSGPGNMFKPGPPAGPVTQFVQFKEGEAAYNTDYKNFAPSLGFAWSPGAKSGWLKLLLGEGGQTVLRGGYSIAYNRLGIGDYSTIFSTNPGVTITANRDLVTGSLAAPNELPVLLRETSRLGRPVIPDAPSYPFTGAITDTANIIDPNIRIPYSQSWTFGLQREITKNMAIEVRYVGTRNLRGFADYDFNSNEQRIVENGMLDEFRLAQANLQANIAAGRGTNFRYFGPNTNTFPLPITMAYLGGTLDPNQAASYTAARLGATTANLFTSGSLFNALAKNNPNVCCGNTSYAATLHSDAARRDNAFKAFKENFPGIFPNLFLTNPDLRGGVQLTSNSGYTRFDSLVLELRRRLSRGLLVQSSYAFSKGFSSTRISFRAPRVNSLNTDVPYHSFKLNWVYELPLGKGKALMGNAGGLLDRLIGGWEFDGTARIQSGDILNFGNVNLVGMTQKEFRKEFGLYFDDANGVVYHLPKDIVDNTIRAFSVSSSTASGYSGPAPTGRYIAPANSASCIQVISGDCAPQNLYVTGPRFTRFDLSAVKRIRITEKVNFELRGEFLNAFNNINFLGSTNMTNFNNALFGQVTSAYQDVNDTQDPGGRLVQIVARINF